jgi:hypothetical protein
MHGFLLKVLFLLTGIYTACVQSVPRYQPACAKVLNAHKTVTRLDSLTKNAVLKGNLCLRSAAGEMLPCSFNNDTPNSYRHIQWLPDSKHLVVFHSSPVAEKPVQYVLSSVDTSSRGILQSHEYAAQPGDPFTGYELF